MVIIESRSGKKIPIEAVVENGETTLRLADNTHPIKLEFVVGGRGKIAARSRGTGPGFDGKFETTDFRRKFSTEHPYGVLDIRPEQFTAIDIAAEKETPMAVDILISSDELITLRWETFFDFKNSREMTSSSLTREPAENNNSKIEKDLQDANHWAQEGEIILMNLILDRIGRDTTNSGIKQRAAEIRKTANYEKAINEHLASALKYGQKGDSTILKIALENANDLLQDAIKVGAPINQKNILSQIEQIRSRFQIDN